MSDVGKWSTVAGNNNKPAPNGWPENMAPSDVNDSARENMAAVKRMTLDLPYISLGGVITYIDSSSFSIADDDLNVNYSQYYTVGRQVKIKSTSEEVIAAILTSEYSSGVTTVTLQFSEGQELPSTVTDVLVGLRGSDIQTLSGPNMLGIILPFTADPDNIPFGMGLADGGTFDPIIYPELAELYYIEDNEEGNPTYKYGQELVKGRWFPKKPDVRGYFPRFLDDRTEDDKVDKDAPRTTGSIQEAAVNSQNLKLRVKYAQYSGSGSAAYGYLTQGVYAASSNRNMWENNYNFENPNIISGSGSETRPVNIAFPGLLVMFGGYASATLIKPEDLVAKVLIEIQPEIYEIEERINEKFAQSFDDMEAQVQAATEQANLAKTYADEAAEVTVGKQDKLYYVATTISASEWNAETKTVSVSIPNLTAIDIVWVSPHSTKLDIDTWSKCGIYGQSQHAGSLVLACEEIPESINVNIGVCPQ